MSQQLEGKIALITGAGRGIGRTIAETFANKDIGPKDIFEIASSN